MLSYSKLDKTVLVVNSDVDVLVLMRGMLENDCRVLLAADAESALRLLTIDGVRIDLAVVDRNVSGLRRRMTGILPHLQIIPMAGSVEDGVIRLQASGASDKRTSRSLLQRIRLALADNAPGSEVMRAGRINVSRPAQVASKDARIASKVMVAGRA